MELYKVLKESPEESQLITDSLVLTHAKLRQYKKVLCSISGGSDSDILLDLCQKFDDSSKITYAFFDTGLEFQATKEHLDYLEKKYEIKIERIKAAKPIPYCSQTYGQPFLSKQVSEWIERLQNHNFQWEEEPFDVLYNKYPKCKAALRWWCNDFARGEGGKESSFNIAYNQYLKEFMIKNPPTFRISNKCCYYAKKMVVNKYKNEEKFDLNMYGVRKAEGGARRSAYKTCFTSRDDSCDEFRPIFWYVSETKKIYEDFYQVEHSKCYSVYGLKRTGCAGCPFARNFEDELKAMEIYEPKLYKAVNNVFRESYEYTRRYRKFVLEMRDKDGKNNDR